MDLSPHTNVIAVIIAMITVMFPIYFLLWKHYRKTQRNSKLREGKEIRAFANTAAQKVIWKNIFDYLVYKSKVKKNADSKTNGTLNLTDYVLAQAPGQLTDVLVQGGINPEHFSIQLLLKETLSKIITNNDIEKLSKYDLKKYTEEEIKRRHQAGPTVEHPDTDEGKVV